MRKIISALILSNLIYLIPHCIKNKDIAWDIYIACSRFELFLWVFVFGLFVPYKQLAIKSVLFSLALFEFIDSIIFTIQIYIPLNATVYVFKIACAVLFFFYIYWKNYDVENDILDEEHFFKIGIIPTEFQDFMLSLHKDPVGGMGVYANGKFYHYRHGMVQIDEKKYVERLTKQKKYKIQKSVKLDKKRTKALEGLEYTKYKKWSWIYNCKTVFEPILTNRGKPLF